MIIIIIVNMLPRIEKYQKIQYYWTTKNVM